MNRASLWLVLPAIVWSLTWSACHAGDEALFTSGVNPHVLIIVDLSISMKLDIAGNVPADEHASRLSYAKAAIRTVLDADRQNPTIDEADERALQIDFGYMRFSGCRSDNLDRCIEVRDEIGSPYRDIWDHIDRETIADAPPGFTPIATVLQKAKAYFQQYECRGKRCAGKYVLLITDGNDTLACDGMKGVDPRQAEFQKDQYKRRRASVAAAKDLAEAGIKVFVVGFGGKMNDFQQRALNWIAYYGGTDNPAMNVPGLLDKSDPAAFYTSIGNPCSGGVIPGTDIVSPVNDGCGGMSPLCFAKKNDPGTIPLEGYAFQAADAAGLAEALKNILGVIRPGEYSFTSPQVSCGGANAGRYLYAASFEPRDDAFWPGHLKKFPIGDNGTIGTPLWDAGEILQRNYNAPGSRTVYTTREGILTPFRVDTMSAELLASPAIDRVVGYTRGEEPIYNPHNQNKLGDIVHTNPVCIGQPTPFFIDFIDKNVDHDGKRGFDRFREGQGGRASVLYAGANDGQLHAFNAETGMELWSFIPPNLLPRLQEITHNVDSPDSPVFHQYLVDGPITAADVWLPSAGNVNGGEKKDGAEWHTCLIVGEGRGGSRTLWSKDPNCGLGFNPLYRSDFPYYCGYYAFDVTNTTLPRLKWILQPGTSDAQYFGQPWAKPAIGRVLDDNREVWVGFLGGGFNGGRGIFAFSMGDGSILWRKAALSHDVVATPLLIDTDQDGFVDRVYAADLGGNVWRFKLCKKGEVCGHASWSGDIFFRSSDNEPVFTGLTAARDADGRLWIYWGTGDKPNPTAMDTTDRFYAVQDDDGAGVGLPFLGTIERYNESPDSYKGWYYSFAARGEKMLSEPSVLNGIVYFTTYVPPDGINADICDQVGYSNFYALHFDSGRGALAQGALYRNAGAGLASSVALVPTKTGTVAFLARSHGKGRPDDRLWLPRADALITNILYWRDKRLK